MNKEIEDLKAPLIKDILLASNLDPIEYAFIMTYIIDLELENKSLSIEINNYISRNEKAIERLKKIQENAIKYGADHDAIICQDLINILQGSDK